MLAEQQAGAGPLRRPLSLGVRRCPESFPFEPELPFAGTPRKGGLSQAFLSEVFDVGSFAIVPVPRLTAGPQRATVAAPF